MKSSKILLILGFGIIAIYSWHVFALFKDSSSILSSIILPDKNRITSISIIPQKPDHPAILLESKNLEHQRIISNFCQALQSSKTWKPIHPRSEWIVVIKIQREMDTSVFKVSKNDSKNGVLLYVYSYGTWGWNLGKYRADALGKIIENIWKI